MICRDAMPTRGPDRRTGVALLGMIIILTFLAFLGLVFLTVLSAERTISRNVLLTARAQLLSRSGVEYALARIDRDRNPVDPANWTAANAESDWTYRDPLGVSVEESDNPSYRIGEEFDDSTGTDEGVYDAADTFDPTTNDRDGDGAFTAYSGRLRGRHQAYGDRFRLKIVPAGGSINLNGGNLERILNNLGEVLGVGTIGTTVTPSAPFGAVEEIRPLLGNAVYAQVRPYVTVNSWIDPDTVRPDPRTDLAWTSTFIPGGLEVAPKLRWTWTLTGETRAPIDVNRADPVVLQALLRNLDAAVTLQENNAGAWWNTDVRHRTRSIEDSGGNAGAIDATEAETLAGHIVAYRNGANGPFETWEEFRRFLEALPGAGVDLSWEQLYTVLANADPNATINKWIPDGAAHYPIDKSDLRVYTTEFAFRGDDILEVTSAGEVADAAGTRIALAVGDASVRLGWRTRVTTQEDFEALAAVRQNVTTLPDPVGTGIAGAAWDGRVGLVTLENDDGIEAFSHKFDDAPSADVTGGTGEPTSPSPKKSTNLTGWDGAAYTGTSLLDGGDLGTGGLVTSHDNKTRLTISEPRPDLASVDQTIELWIKKRHTESPTENRAFYDVDDNTGNGYQVNWLGTYLNLVVPEAADSAHVWWGMGFRNSFFGGYGTFPSINVYGGVSEGPTLPPSAYDHWGRSGGIARCDDWTNGEWHHIVFFRRNGNEQSLIMIDGKDTLGTVHINDNTFWHYTLTTPDGLANIELGYWFDDIYNQLGISGWWGSFGNGANLYSDCAIDHVRISPSIKYGMDAVLQAQDPGADDTNYLALNVSTGFSPPSRYLLVNPLDPPHVTLAFDTSRIPPSARLSRLEWTERRPVRDPYTMEMMVWDSPGVGELLAPDIHLAYAVDPSDPAGYVRVSDLAGIDPALENDPDGAGAAIVDASGGAVDMGSTFYVRAEFDSQGLDPNNTTPYLEDVTVVWREVHPVLFQWKPTFAGSAVPPASIAVPDPAVTPVEPSDGSVPRYADPATTPP